MLEDLRPLVIFSKTAETGSFRETARFFGLSPSVVSHHISQLEKRYDTTLFYRSTRSLSLTETGRKVFNEAQALTRSAETLTELLAEGSSQIAGKLSISMSSALLSHPIMTQINSFVQDFPDISLSIIITDERTNLIEKGVDLAFRVGNLEDSSLRTITLGHIERTLVCAPTLASSYSEPINPSDIAKWPWIRLAMLPSKRDVIGPDGKVETIHFTSRIETNNVLSMHSLTKAGLGIAALPRLQIAEDIETGELLNILPGWSVTSLPINAVWPSSVSKQGLARRLVEYIANHIDMSKPR
ncbi:LysR family transcriptional regulator [Curvivirga sp.]|uniref:LysR family transcriptional regulator n=1 Tax=Curvivirga sp. TaxID=2856848 RepID=UPI003B5CD437